MRTLYVGGASRSLRPGGYVRPEAGAGAFNAYSSFTQSHCGVATQTLRSAKPGYSHGVRGAALVRTARRQPGVSFRRQVVVGNRFIVDFLAPRARLVVEVDGCYHAQRLAADARRDTKLRALGYRVLRLPAALVVSDLHAAVELVRAAL